MKKHPDFKYAEVEYTSMYSAGWRSPIPTSCDDAIGEGVEVLAALGEEVAYKTEQFMLATSATTIFEYYFAWWVS
jgi:hypothetical protein